MKARKDYVMNYYNKLRGIRTLPTSPILKGGFELTEKGFFNLDACKTLNSEQSKFISQREKAWPTRICLYDNGNLVSHYFKPFPFTQGISSSCEKMLSNFLGRLYPTKMNYYLTYYNNCFGTLGIDLNNIDQTKSMRLDQFLYKKGVEIDSLSSFVREYRKGAFSDELSSGAIAQLFIAHGIANAVGEVDPNARNTILLGSDKRDSKFDSIVRIDFDKTQDMRSERSNSVVPFGMNDCEESLTEMKENIIKSIVDKEISSDDAKLLYGMHQVVEYATSRSPVDDEFTMAASQHGYCQNGALSYDNIFDVSERTIQNSRLYSKNMNDAFSKSGIESPIFLPIEPNQ